MAYLEFYDAVMWLVLFLAMVYLIGIVIKVILPALREVSTRPAGATCVGLSAGNGLNFLSMVETIEYLETLAADTGIDWSLLLSSERDVGTEMLETTNSPYTLRIKMMNAVIAKHTETGVLDTKFRTARDMLLVPVSLRASGVYGETLFSGTELDVAWNFSRLSDQLFHTIHTRAAQLFWTAPLKDLFPSEYAYGDLRLCPLLVEWLRSVHLLELSGTTIETGVISCDVRAPPISSNGTTSNGTTSDGTTRIAARVWYDALTEALDKHKDTDVLREFKRDIALVSTGLAISMQTSEQFTMPILDCKIVYSVDRADLRNIAAEQYIVMRYMTTKIDTDPDLRAKLLAIATMHINACLVSDITRLYESYDRPLTHSSWYKRPYLFYLYFRYRWMLSLRGPRNHRVRIVVCISRNENVYQHIVGRVGYSHELLLPNPYIYHPQDDEYDYLDNSGTVESRPGLFTRTIRYLFAPFAVASHAFCTMSLLRRMFAIFAFFLACLSLFTIIVGMGMESRE